MPAKLKGLVMTMFHHNLVGEEAPFGMITFTAKDATFLPARGSAAVKAEVEHIRVFPLLAHGYNFRRLLIQILLFSRIELTTSVLLKVLVGVLGYLLLIL